MLARDWYYNERRLIGLDSAVASIYELPFADASFDYVYSWGVLHHSPDLARSITELMRVLRPGGGFGVMARLPIAAVTAGAA